MVRRALFIFLTLLSSALYAGKPQRIELDFFYASTCSYCHQANAYLYELQQEYRWLSVRRTLIDQDQAALRDFHARLKEHGEDSYAVPAMFFCHAYWVGFANTPEMKAQLLESLMYCHTQIEKEGTLSKKTIKTLNRMNRKVFGKLMEPKMDLEFLVIPAAITLFLLFVWFFWRRFHA